LLLTVIAVSAQAQSLSVLRVEGIPGTSQLPGYADWIDTLDYAASAGNLGAGVEFRPLELTKQADASDPKFFENLANQTTLLNACALSYGLGGDGVVLRIAGIGLEGVTVTNLTPSNSGDDVQQRISLDYEKIAIISYKLDSEGNPDGEEVFCWDVATGKDCGSNPLGCPKN
jgi:type VI protein secretion system component Hcp